MIAKFKRVVRMLEACVDLMEAAHRFNTSRADVDGKRRLKQFHEEQRLLRRDLECAVTNQAKLRIYDIYEKRAREDAPVDEETPQEKWRSAKRQRCSHPPGPVPSLA